MSKRATILTLVAVMAIGVSTALAGGQGKTVEGTLVDTKCYLMNSANTGNDHGKMTGCGTACAKMGIPVSVLTAEGKVLTLAIPAGQVADYVGKTARVTGAVKHGAIVAEGIEVKEGNSWKKVDLATMM